MVTRHRIAFLLVPFLLVGCGKEPVTEVAAVAQVPIETERPAPDAPPIDRSRQLVALGEHLFANKKLSVNKSVSCATCHDPERYFTDGEKESTGAMLKGVGLNSATLIGLRDRTAFPPSPFVHGESVTVVPGDTLTLEDRCLAPITNPIEMGRSIPYIVEALTADDDVRKRFGEAFGTDTIDGKRIGRALAAYVRSIELPAAPYRDYLAGNKEALNEQELRGLAIFRGKGRCSGCHSGTALSDGKMHVALLPSSPRAAQRRRTARPIGYGKPSTFITPTPTLTLWAITETGPYFRDGSVAKLDDAVRTHIKELRAVARGPGEADPGFVEILPPKALSPAYPIARPLTLMNDEFDDLMAFLTTLSRVEAPQVAQPIPRSGAPGHRNTSTLMLRTGPASRSGNRSRVLPWNATRSLPGSRRPLTQVRRTPPTSKMWRVNAAYAERVAKLQDAIEQFRDHHLDLGRRGLPGQRHGAIVGHPDDDPGPRPGRPPGPPRDDEHHERRRDAQPDQSSPTRHRGPPCPTPRPGRRPRGDFREIRTARWCARARSRD